MSRQMIIEPSGEDFRCLREAAMLTRSEAAALHPWASRTGDTRAIAGRIARIEHGVVDYYSEEARYFTALVRALTMKEMSASTKARLRSA